jgi:formamidopyrimidine-DNA glycosylase
MPELPEVETVCQGLRPHMEGKRLTKVEVRRKDLRFPFPRGFAKRLEGAKVLSLTRRAKYILADLSTGETLIMHLGMSGRFTIDQTEEKHEHVVFHMSGKRRIGYVDPRRFGMMDLITTNKVHEHKLFHKLGLEPLGNELCGVVLGALLKNKRTPIKAALLDQRLIAGLGNIYVCEALYRAGISPKRQAGTIPGKRAERLAPIIREVLSDAVAAGGSTLKDYAQVDGELGYFQHAFQVYGREGEPCVNKTCGRNIRRIVQSGRSTFYCSACQK